MSKQSPNAFRAEQWIKETHPWARFSRVSCRNISGTSRPSQHAGSKEDDSSRGWHPESNALDIFGPDKKASASSRALLKDLAAELLEVKGSFDEYGWGFFHILWDGKSLTTGNDVKGHKNHIHLDFSPYMRATDRYDPPCMGGSRLIVDYPDGRIGHDFVLWSLGGNPPDGSTGGGDDVEQVYKDLQEGLKAAGFYSGAIDGIWGPLSKAAYAEMCNGANGKHAHEGHVSNAKVTQISQGAATITVVGGDNVVIPKG